MVKKLFSGLLVLALIFCLIPPMHSYAATSYEMEPNDSKDRADTITNGTTMTGTTGSSYSGSHDYFKFTLDTYASVTMNLYVSSTSARVEFGDKYETLEYYYSFYNYGGSYKQRRVTKTLAPGTYYLTMIRGYGDYQISVSWYERTSTCSHYGTWKTEKSATCTADGESTRVCTSCGIKEYRIDPAKGHTWGDPTTTTQPTCTKTGVSAIKCKSCFTVKEETEIPALGHDWDYGKLTTAPSDGKEGEISYTCRRCSDTNKESIPALTAEPTYFGVSWKEVTVFDGTEKEPKPVISYKGKELVEDKDYTLSYHNNLLASNHAVVMVTGKGDYEGKESTVEFAIQPMDISFLKESFYAESVSYMGREVEPSSITLTDANGVSLKEGEDYTYICTDNVAVGKGQIRIMGMGNYTGYFDATFAIDSRDAVSVEEITLVADEMDDEVYTVAEGSKITIKMGTVTDGTVTINGSYAPVSKYASYTFTPEVGENAVKHSYSRDIYEYSYEYVNGVYRQVKRYVGTETYTDKCTVIVVDETADAADTIIAQPPVFQDSDTIYLEVGSKNNGTIENVIWKSSDPSVATVEDGIVTLLKEGAATITATVGEQTVSWTTDDLAALSLAKNTNIAGYDPATGKALVTWKNEVLVQDKDYTVSTQTLDGVIFVTVTGKNNFCDSTTKRFYEGTCYPHNCYEHTWEGGSCTEPQICKYCKQVGSVTDDHQWKDATCLTPKTCSACGKTTGYLGKHVEVKDPGKAATCTTPGLTDGSHCSVCNGILTVQTTIPSTGHVTVTDKAVAATCTATGLTEGSHCSACNTVIKAQTKLPALGHKWDNGVITRPAKPSVPGEKTYTCTVCKATKKEQVVFTGVDVERIWGASRYKTSLAIAEELKAELGISKFGTVIIANGDNFPDALAGSYLAAKKNAPILMTNPYESAQTVATKPDSTNATVQKYIEKNLKAGGKVYILGGEKAVPDYIEANLKNKGYDVERLKGKARYETNLEILKEAGVSNEALLVCTGDNFADSLSASASGLPILLVNPKTKQLSTAQIEFLDDAKRDIYIIGGTGAVDAKYETLLATYDKNGKVERVKGKSRYETSIEVAEKFCGTPDKAVVASAQKFPDGLCGGPLAYVMDAPLILTHPTADAKKISPAKLYIADKKIASGKVLGGTGALADDVVRSIFEMKAKDRISGTKYN